MSYAIGHEAGVGHHDSQVYEVDTGITILTFTLQTLDMVMDRVKSFNQF